MSHQQMIDFFFYNFIYKACKLPQVPFFLLKIDILTQNPILTSFPAQYFLNQSKVFAKIFSIVDLPAPFFPTRPTRSPAPNRK
jgi:hypothetical protein